MHPSEAPRHPPARVRGSEVADWLERTRSASPEIRRVAARAEDPRLLSPDRRVERGVAVMPRALSACVLLAMIVACAQVRVVDPNLGRVPPGDEQNRAAYPIERVAPDYPAELRNRGVEGYVALTLDINPRGTVSDVRVFEAKPPGIFEDLVVTAARRWRFKPKIANGQPVQSSYRSFLGFCMDEGELRPGQTHIRACQHPEGTKEVRTEILRRMKEQNPTAN
jgi:TonB family protein